LAGPPPERLLRREQATHVEIPHIAVLFLALTNMHHGSYSAAKGESGSFLRYIVSILQLRTAHFVARCHLACIGESAHSSCAIVLKRANLMLEARSWMLDAPCSFPLLFEEVVWVVRFPGFYDPSRIGTLFYPDVAAIAADAAVADLQPATTDPEDTHLVIIDMQIDFCHARGNLNVPGSAADIQRTIEFIYHNAERITHITCSLDSHLPAQIFSPGWWIDRDGHHPAAFTIITWADVQAGIWRPVQDFDASLAYVRQLEEQHKKQLCIWPYHVQIGSIGHALDPELWSAVFWHALARQAQPVWLTKGRVPLTEHYSILQPEVPVSGDSEGGKNQAFLDILAQADHIVIAGEAESHCVLETVEDLVEEFAGRPEMLRKVYFLRDCTSPVLHPQIDFHAIAQARFAEFARRGVNFIDSTAPLPF